MSDLPARVAAKKAELDRRRPLHGEALDRLARYYDVELTYTSNAIEGNTLTAVETGLVIEHGVTIAGKSLKHHMEAIDHYEAVRYVRDIARTPTPLNEGDVRQLHALVLRRADVEIAGRYATSGRFVRTETGRHVFPGPLELPALMRDFGDWLRAAADTPGNAFEAHRRLVEIHPFADGNGRTARLLMNLLLLCGGWPPIAVRPEDRVAYLRALQSAQAGSGTEAFDTLLYERLEATLDDHLAALAESPPRATA